MPGVSQLFYSCPRRTANHGSTVPIQTSSIRLAGERTVRAVSNHVIFTGRMSGPSAAMSVAGGDRK
jgi:hypothetical protein